jgi:hypothetical protein
MPREPLNRKAERLLNDHRLQITRLDGDQVEAVIQGDHGNYRLGHRDGRWTCSCPARIECAHIVALTRVTTPCPAYQPIHSGP